MRKPKFEEDKGLPQSYKARYAHTRLQLKFLYVTLPMLGRWAQIELATQLAP